MTRTLVIKKSLIFILRRNSKYNELSYIFDHFVNVNNIVPLKKCSFTKNGRLMICDKEPSFEQMLFRNQPSYFKNKKNNDNFEGGEIILLDEDKF